jgi:hypothetical protein
MRHNSHPREGDVVAFSEPLVPAPRPSMESAANALRRLRTCSSRARPVAPAPVAPVAP